MGDLLQRIAEALESLQRLKPFGPVMGPLLAAAELLPECARELERLEKELTLSTEVANEAFKTADGFRALIPQINSKREAAEKRMEKELHDVKCNVVMFCERAASEPRDRAEAYRVQLAAAEARLSIAEKVIRAVDDARDELECTVDHEEDDDVSRRCPKRIVREYIAALSPDGGE